MALKTIEIYVLSVIKNQRTGMIPSLLKALLTPASWLFRAVVYCRSFAYERGWFRRYHPPVPLVISVGNIAIGGTGKTSVALMLAKEFYGKLPMAIISRGYRSQAEKLAHPTWLCNGQGPTRPAIFCGDEPFMLAQNLPKAMVIVGKDRLQGAIMAAKAGAKLLLLEDGMQNRRIARDVEIVVMDGRDLFGQGHFLPRGFLREGRHALARADLIIINHVADSDDFNEKKAIIGRYSSAPFIGTRLEMSGVFDFRGTKIDSLKDRRVGLFCGLARPEYFESTVTAEGAAIVDRHLVPDHYTFKQQALDKFSISCQKQGADLLLCTEKDRVRFTAPPSLSLPVAWVQTQLTIAEGAEEWIHFIEKAKDDVLKHQIGLSS